MKNYYQVLGVDSTADNNAIIIAFNQKIAVADVSDEDLVLLATAVNTLLDQIKRADHNIYLAAYTNAQACRFQVAIHFLEGSIRERNDHYWFQLASYCLKMKLLSRALSILHFDVKEKEGEYFCLLTEYYINTGANHCSRYKWSDAIKNYQLALETLEKKSTKNNKDFQVLIEICKNLLNLHHVNNDEEQSGLYHKMLNYEASLKAFKSTCCSSALFSAGTKKIELKPIPIPAKKEIGCTIS